MMSAIDPASAGTMAAGSVINTILDLTQKGLNVKSNLKQTSLTSITGVARVEPLCIVDSQCVHLDYITDVLQTMQSLFSGYYVQALALISDVGGVRAVKILDQLNPNRKTDLEVFFNENKKAAFEQWRVSEESHKWRLPSEHNKPAMEAELNQLANVDTKQIGTIADYVNLSVGKMVEVTIRGEGGNTIKVPVAIRLMVNQISNDGLMAIFGIGSEDKSLTERFFKWRAGRIEFIRDLILCQDLIKNRKKVLMEDKDGVLSEMMKRENNNKIASFLTKQPSMAAASNLVVVCEETAEEVKLKHNIDLKKFSDRQKFFENTAGMIIAVIDRQWERVNFYHRDISASTSVGIRDLKAGNKGTGPDIADIMKAYMGGHAPL